MVSDMVLLPMSTWEPSDLITAETYTHPLLTPSASEQACGHIITGYLSPTQPRDAGCRLFPSSPHLLLTLATSSASTRGAGL